MPDAQHHLETRRDGEQPDRRRRHGRVIPALGVALAAGMAAAPAAPAAAWGPADTTSVVSLTNDGLAAGAEHGTISGNGRFVAFTSASPDAVAGDTNGVKDVFLRDRLAGTTVRVSVGANGQQARGRSDHPGLSASGRFVVFSSQADNLVPGDRNGKTWDVFLRDIVSRTTRVVSVDENGQWLASGGRWAAISGDGQWVAFTEARTLTVRLWHRGSSRTKVVGAGSPVAALSHSGRYLAYTGFSVPQRTTVYDNLTGTSRWADEAVDGGVPNSGTRPTGISTDGRYVVLMSEATNLVPGDTNGMQDVFVRDLVANRTTRVSVSSGGAQGDGWSAGPVYGNGISGDGRYVLFESFSTNLVTGDTNNWLDAFIHSTVSGRTYLITRTSAGVQLQLSSHTQALSGDGRHALFAGSDILPPRQATSDYDLFVRDMAPQ